MGSQDAVPAGVRTHQVDNAGGFLNIPRRGQGDVNLSARHDHDILNMTTAKAASFHQLHKNNPILGGHDMSMAMPNQPTHSRVNQSMQIIPGGAAFIN